MRADDGVALIVAEALAAVDDAQAPAAFGALASGRVAADAKRALARLDARARGLGQMAGDAVGLPGGVLAGPADDAVAARAVGRHRPVRRRPRRKLDDAVASLRDSPPHEGAAGPATLHAAALIAEGRGKTADAAALDAAALNAAGGNPDALSIAVLARIAEGDGKPELRVGAMELAAARFTQEQATIALAVVDSMRARLADDAGDRASAAEQLARGAGGRSRLSAGGARDPARRRPARRPGAGPRCDRGRGGLPARARAPGSRPAARRRAGRGRRARPRRRRAAVTLRGPPSTDAGRSRCCARCWRLDPGHEGAFEQLRTLLGDAADTAALSAALAARIAAAANPFEVTSLRLARAELLAGTLGDRTGARVELDAILHKQPEHPRALARLSELLWDEQAWSDAGEVYLRRTGVEREPAALRESFLRLGHIYRERVPDARRAITAYERVRGIEPDNREALQALSELYLAEGDTKQALPVTERLVATEADAKKRTAYRVRLGDLLMRAGDLRRAGTELRRAVDGDPRNVAAVTTLAHLLERGRDPGGRRALLDHTVGLAPSRRRARRAEPRHAARARGGADLARQAARGGGCRRPGGGPGGGRARRQGGPAGPPGALAGRPAPARAGRAVVPARAAARDTPDHAPGRAAPAPERRRAGAASGAPRRLAVRTGRARRGTAAGVRQRRRRAGGG